MTRRGVHERWLAVLLLSTVTGTAVMLHEQSDAATTDPHAAHVMPAAIPAAVTIPVPLPRTAWTVTADSAGEPAAEALDGDPDSVWRSTATDLPHTLTVDTHNSVAVSGLTYLPPADPADGRIGQYRITTSADGATWSAPVGTGTFADDAVLKTATFGAVITRYVRLTALTEAGDRGSRVGAAELNLLGGIDPAL